MRPEAEALVAVESSSGNSNLSAKTFADDIYALSGFLKVVHYLSPKVQM